jgi:endonuclease/exonuclease/phosphatase family metal-dependent hydrolase
MTIPQQSRVSLIFNNLNIFKIFFMTILSAAWNFQVNAESQSSLKLQTYNIGLAHQYVLYAQDRINPLMEELKNSDSDILCLQELWLPSDVEKFKNALKEKFPHQHGLNAHQKFTTQSPICSVSDIGGGGKLGRCLYNNCLKTSGDEFTQCVTGTCRNELNTLKNDNPQCAAALFAQVDQPLWKTLSKVLLPFMKLGLYAYEGEAGIYLFSKYPFEETDALDFLDSSTTNRRAGLYAKVKVNGQNHHVLCTHLTANFEKTIPYTGQYNTWGNENKVQIQSLLDFLNTKTKKTSDPIYAMGDFNCGPSLPEFGIQGDLESNCQLFEKNGYLDPISSAEFSTPECSFCRDNTLNAANKEQTSHLIDHVFIKNVKSPWSMESEVNFKNEVSLPGIEKKQNLSDHYGVKTEIFF